jgi:four helix bundle protein
MSDFRKLEVWRKAHALVLNVDRAATRIRRSDYASLRNQIIRAAMSIPTNIVEGTGQRTAKEYARFVRIALNSASELEYHLMLARDVHVIKAEEIEALLAQTIEIRKMLYGLLKSLARPTRSDSATDGLAVVT